MASAEAGVAESEARIRARARPAEPSGARASARLAAEAKRVRGARDRTAAVLDERRGRGRAGPRGARASSESCERGPRERAGAAPGQAKRDAERAAVPESCAACRSSSMPWPTDAIALLGGFDSWRQAPDKWLVEGIAAQRAAA